MFSPIRFVCNSSNWFHQDSSDQKYLLNLYVFLEECLGFKSEASMRVQLLRFRETLSRDFKEKEPAVAVFLDMLAFFNQVQSTIEFNSKIFRLIFQNYIFRVRNYLLYLIEGP